MPPLLVPHYDIHTAIAQKVKALASRSLIQARDVFDLFVLSSQYEPQAAGKTEIDKSFLPKAYDNIFEVTFEQFRDTVVSYLSEDDKAVYDKQSVWEDVKLKTARFMEEMKR